MRLTPTEAETQKAIMELLAVYRVFAGRINTGAGFMNGRPVQHHTFGKGCADILAFPRICDECIEQDQTLGHPAPLWIECKSHDGRQSALQAEFEEFVKKQGHDYLLARSVDDVMGWMKAHGIK